MNCPKCGEQSQKFGKTRDGQQRYRCSECKKTFSEPKPLAGLATPIKQASQAMSMLLEGMSVRATSRLTGLDKNTILRIMVQAGRQCQQLMADKMHDVRASEIQVDEVWSYVGMKDKTAFYQGSFEGCGDAYVFTAIDRHSKLLVCFHVGKRSADDAQTFARKLAVCISHESKPHISTDGYTPYHTAIPDAFGNRVNHGMLIKQYGNATTAERRRYSPPSIIGAKQYQNAGKSEAGQICTSHIERSNLTVRMQNRRFTRLTNAFSKSWENHELMFALFAAWYNFVRPHMTLKTTPAVAAGLAKAPWTMERLLEESAKALAD